MVILAVETVTRGGSLAVWKGGICEAAHGDATRSPAERLPGDALALLDSCGVGLDAVDILAVVTGPGSFTGLRVGIACIQGFALAGGIRTIGIPTLDALITTWRLDRDEDAQIVACLDGQRGELFLTAVEATAGARLDTCPVLLAPLVARPADAAARIAAVVSHDRRIVLVGDGAVRYADALRQRIPRADIVEAPHPLAMAAAHLAAQRASEAGAPHALRAVYLRRPDVVLARERKAAVSAPTQADDRSIIRLASTTSDLEAVERLQRKTFTNPWGREAIRWELENTDVARLYVLDQPGEGVVAYCACWVVFDELHINSLAVDPAWRRRGLAQRLLRHVIADAARAGARSATLEVRASNEAARRLYEGLDFVVEGVRRDYYRDPREDALILWNRNLLPTVAVPGSEQAASRHGID